MEVAEKQDSALSTIMRYGMSRIATAQRREDIEKAMEESLIEVIPHLEKRTHYLATLANVGMLMGLLGTVIGLINAFAAVAAVNPAEKAAMLSASISVAVNDTSQTTGSSAPGYWKVDPRSSTCPRSTTVETGLVGETTVESVSSTSVMRSALTAARGTSTSMKVAIMIAPRICTR